MYSISKVVKEKTGLTMQEFCKRELNTGYKAFMMRLRAKRLYPAEVFYLVWRLEYTIEELFGTSWTNVLVIDQGGPTSEKVAQIIDNMGEETKVKMKSLLGFDHLKDVQHDPKVRPPTPPPTPKSPPPQAHVKDVLKDFFIQTYKEES